MLCKWIRQKLTSTVTDSIKLGQHPQNIRIVDQLLMFKCSFDNYIAIDACNIRTFLRQNLSLERSPALCGQANSRHVRLSFNAGRTFTIQLHS